MQIGIVGLPYTGKTTVFNALSGQSAPTGQYVEGAAETHRGVLEVPDERIDKLAEIFKPKKITYATIELCDVAGLKKGTGQDAGLSAHLLAQLREVDALALVLRVFERASVPHPEGSVDPVRDLETLLTEMKLADLAVAEKRIPRIEERLQKVAEEKDRLTLERDSLKKAMEALEAGHWVREIDFNDIQQKAIKGYGFLTGKPAVVLANVGDLTDGTEQKRLEALRKAVEENRLPMVVLNADLECELRQVESEEDQREYLEAMGIEKRGTGEVIRACFDITHGICFLTGGPEEVRAWPVREGSKAVEAAGAIHSDIARGFIRAEVVPYEHFKDDGSFSKAKENGHYREEGRDAIINDGDVVLFKFNV